jgi:hypothetical protein
MARILTRGSPEGLDDVLAPGPGPEVCGLCRMPIDGTRNVRAVDPVLSLGFASGVPLHEACVAKARAARNTNAKIDHATRGDTDDPEALRAAGVDALEYTWEHPASAAGLELATGARAKPRDVYPAWDVDAAVAEAVRTHGTLGMHGEGPGAELLRAKAASAARVRALDSIDAEAEPRATSPAKPPRCFDCGGLHAEGQCRITKFALAAERAAGELTIDEMVAISWLVRTAGDDGWTGARLASIAGLLDRAATRIAALAGPEAECASCGPVADADALRGALLVCGTCRRGYAPERLAERIRERGAARNPWHLPTSCEIRKQDGRRYAGDYVDLQCRKCGRTWCYQPGEEINRRCPTPECRFGGDEITTP